MKNRLDYPTTLRLATGFSASHRPDCGRTTGARRARPCQVGLASSRRARRSRAMVCLLLTLSSLRSPAANLAENLVNLGEKHSYPTLASVSRVFHDAQKPEVMFLGSTGRFKEASLDQIAENGLPFFQTNSTNLSSLLQQTLALGNVTTRVLAGEPVLPVNRPRLLAELATIDQLRLSLHAFLAHVPAENHILVRYRGAAHDVRVQLEAIARDCYLASRLLDESRPQYLTAAR